MTITVSFLSCLVAQILLSAFFARAWLNSEGSSRGRFLALAMATSIAWVLAVLLAADSVTVYGWLAVDGLNGLRIMAWITLLYALAGPASVTSLLHCQTIPDRLMVIASGLLLLKLGALVVAYTLPEQAFSLTVAHMTGLGLAVVGLILIDTLIAYAEPTRRWASKHLLLGIGAMLAFDIFYYSDLLLLRRMNEFSMTGQAWIAIFAVPLVVVGTARIRDFALAIPISREAVLQTSALIGCGAYLLAVALVTYSLQGLGWSWTPALQLVFVSGAALLLLVLASSGQLRDQWRHLITRNFFSFSHDYRREWQRLLAIMNDDTLETLHQRLIRAAAGPFQCSGGALFLQTRHGGLQRQETWNWLDHHLPTTLPPITAEALASGCELKELPGHTTMSLSDERVWLLLTLRGRGQRRAIMVLGKPRVRRRLTWEDHELLAMLGDQLGSYLVEEQLAVALDEARRFERMSKNFSFVAHDLKNIVTQLSLLLQQADRHGDKPEFLADTWLTVQDAVEKMKTMLLRLNKPSPDHDAKGQTLELTPALADVIIRKQHGELQIRYGGHPDPIAITVEPTAFATVIEQLIDNALEAGGNIDISAGPAPKDSAGPAMVAIAIRDDGHGMSESFIKDRLFQPFVSTKADGFGVGMFQAREWIESWQGRMEVVSTPQHGTTITLYLPMILLDDANKNCNPANSPALPSSLNAGPITQETTRF